MPHFIKLHLFDFPACGGLRQVFAKLAHPAELKQLPDCVAAIIASARTRVLPATIGFMRPNWVFRDYPGIRMETSWHDWPDRLKKQPALETLAQEEERERHGFSSPPLIQEMPVHYSAVESLKHSIICYSGTSKPSLRASPHL